MPSTFLQHKLTTVSLTAALPIPPAPHTHFSRTTQAENVLALVNARTSAAADSALAGLQGGLGQLVSECRRDVLSIITELEARLDFDEDLPPLDVEQLKQDIAGTCRVVGQSSSPC
jgi:tRNA U34 5-carboxymethylaminomethyl modifying GTPase MnmE/TrmE